MPVLRKTTRRRSRHRGLPVTVHLTKRTDASPAEIERQVEVLRAKMQDFFGDAAVVTVTVDDDNNE